MNKYLQKLRSKDGASKRVVAALFSFCITLIIVVLWFLIKSIL